MSASSHPPHRFALAYAGLMVRRPGTVLLVILALLGISLYGTSKLTINSNQLDLISQELPEVKEVKRIIDMVGGSGYFMLALRSSDEATLKRVADDLAAKLEADKEHVRFVTYKIPVEFVQQNMALFIKTEDLAEGKKRISAYMKDQLRRNNPFFIELKKTEPVKLDLQDLIAKYSSVGKKSIIDDYYISPDRKMMMMLIKPMWDTNELGKTKAYVAKLNQDLAEYSKANAQGVKLVEDYDLMGDAKTVAYGYTGSYKTAVDDSYAIEESLQPVALIAFLAILAITIVFFRKWAPTVIVVSGMVIGTIITMGFTYATVGELNMITSILGGILMGFGIDFGIHFVFRTRLELGAGKPYDIAIRDAIINAGRPAAVSAVVTAGSFFVLMVSEFRGFSQFGFLAGCGTLILGLTLFSWSPALLALIGRMNPALPEKLVGTMKPPATNNAAGKEIRFPRPRLLLGISTAIVAAVCACAIPWSNLEVLIPLFIGILVVGCTIILGLILGLSVRAVLTHLMGVGIPQPDEVEIRLPWHARWRGKRLAIQMAALALGAVPALIVQSVNLEVVTGFIVQSVKKPLTRALEPAINKLPETIRHGVRFNYNTRALMPAKQPSVQLQDEIARRFQISSDPIAVYTKTLEEAKEVYDELTGHPEKYKSIDQVVSIYTFVPPPENAQANAKILAEWEDELKEINVESLPPEMQEKAGLFKKMLSARPFDVNGVPDIYAKQFRHLPETKPENHGFLTFIYPSVDLWDGKLMLQFADETGVIKTASGKEFRSAGAAQLYARLARIVLKDGQLTVILVALWILIMHFADFRNVPLALASVIPLTVGLAMMLGFMSIFDLRLNFMNIIILPILLGFGVSHGLYLLHRFLEGTSPVVALRSVGAAVASSTLTAVSGFAALLAASHIGLRSMGVVACIGLITTLVVSFTVLAAVMQLMHDRRVRKSGKQPPSDSEASGGTSSETRAA